MSEPDSDYASQAADFIAEAQRAAALGLPVLPDDPSAAAEMRAAGYDVLAGCVRVGAHGTAFVAVAGEDEEDEQRIPSGELAAALALDPDDLPGTEFLAHLQETPDAGRVLSAFRPLPDALA